MESLLITESTDFLVNGVLCVSARFTTQDLSYYIGYALFPAEFKDVVEQLEGEDPAGLPVNITYFNSYGVPELLKDRTFKGKNLAECEFYYLGADTAPYGGDISKTKIKEYLTGIVRLVKERAMPYWYMRNKEK